MDPALLRLRLSTTSDSPALDDHVLEPANDSLIPAAVLVPIVMDAEPSVLLTKRTGTLRSHGGQVSFPGGRIDPEDPDIEAAALREASEEIGLDPRHVEVLGRLAGYVTGTGYHITPVLGLIPANLALRPSPAEVECVFTLPIAALLDQSGPRRERAFYRERWRDYWVWPHDEHYIWGATAAILLNLAQRLRG